MNIGCSRFSVPVTYSQKVWNSQVICKFVGKVWNSQVICKFVGSRIGLLGNPSDGFGGKTLAVMINDFWASVTVRENPVVCIIPHPQFDPFNFASLGEMARTATRDGYYGGSRLLYAACKRFHDYCTERGIGLPSKGFTIEYDTNIPRQVGLAGSSAIVTAAIHALMDLYGVTDEDIPKHAQPHLVLSAETEELEIQAGLQDRVVQVYGGAVYMDFNADYIAEHGHGIYRPLSLELLPPLYIAWDPRATKTSGKMHNPMRYRYERGDPEVISGMNEIAALTDAGYEALKQQDFAALGELMNQNFDLRRRLYDDEAIGAQNLQMIEIARRHGLPAKFPGSGGAIVGIYQDEEQVEATRKALYQAGYQFALVTPTQSPQIGE